MENITAAHFAMSHSQKKQQQKKKLKDAQEEKTRFFSQQAQALVAGVRFSK